MFQRDTAFNSIKREPNQIGVGRGCGELSKASRRSGEKSPFLKVQLSHYQNGWVLSLTELISGLANQAGHKSKSAGS